MAIKKVRVEMDETFYWWIPEENDYYYHELPRTLEVDETLLEELKQASKQYWELQRKLEKMYREQEGMKPSEN